MVLIYRRPVSNPQYKSPRFTAHSDARIAPRLSTPRLSTPRLHGNRKSPRFLFFLTAVARDGSRRSLWKKTSTLTKFPSASGFFFPPNMKGNFLLKFLCSFICSHSWRKKLFHILRCRLNPSSLG